MTDQLRVESPLAPVSSDEPRTPSPRPVPVEEQGSSPGGTKAAVPRGSLFTPRVPPIVSRYETLAVNKNNPAAWDEMLEKHHAKNLTPVKFIDKYMQRRESDEEIVLDIVKKCSNVLANAKAAAAETRNSPPEHPPTGAHTMVVKTENGMIVPLIQFLRQLVSDFDPKNKPKFDDTHNTQFKSLDDNQRYTKPDVAGSRPGLEVIARWTWGIAGIVLELMYRTDVFGDDEEISKADDARQALVQLAKSARSLLMASASCHVYVIAIFSFNQARIFRFDRAGFRATKPFDWIQEPQVFARFFLRLYNPPNRPGRMHGEDDTIVIPNSKERQKMHGLLCMTEVFSSISLSEDGGSDDGGNGKKKSGKDEDTGKGKKKQSDWKTATKHSLWIKAVRVVNGVAQLVDCFTIGPILSISDGLFGRATRVYRVIIKQDLDDRVANPTVYALKDVWRQACRRQEADFYDIIAAYCKQYNVNMDEKELARCHGSVDLSVNNPNVVWTASWDLALHRTQSASEPVFERCHTRTLLTPIGIPLNQFPSTQDLAHALESAVIQLEVAYQAGVIHRDVSELNTLFAGGTLPNGLLRACLFDWDYSELTSAGVKALDSLDPPRMPARTDLIDKRLQEFTGTYPFIAIELLRNNQVSHGPHHDLESVFWVLIWMILRHTKHLNPHEKHACSQIFDGGFLAKAGFVFQPENNPVSPTVPLYDLLEILRQLVSSQNKPAQTNRPSRIQIGSNAPADQQQLRQVLTHQDVLVCFKQALTLEGWPAEDRALPFTAPKPDPSIGRVGSTSSRAAEGSGSMTKRNSSSKKRIREELETEDGSGSGTLISSGASGSAAPVADGNSASGPRKKLKEAMKGKQRSSMGDSSNDRKWTKW